MRKTILIAAVVTGLTPCFTTLNADSQLPNFWDAIAVSPSTRAAKEIKDEYWHGQFKRVNREVAGADNAKITFFGDSITWHWSLGAGTGKAVWKESYAIYKPINMGNSGDITPVMKGSWKDGILG